MKRGHTRKKSNLPIAIIQVLFLYVPGSVSLEMPRISRSALKKATGHKSQVPELLTGEELYRHAFLSSQWSPALPPGRPRRRHTPRVPPCSSGEKPMYI